jgi:hypothetical protein
MEDNLCSTTNDSPLNDLKEALQEQYKKYTQQSEDAYQRAISKMKAKLVPSQRVSSLPNTIKF